MIHARSGGRRQGGAYLAAALLILGLLGLVLVVYGEGTLLRAVGGAAVLTAGGAETLYWLRVVGREWRTTVNRSGSSGESDHSTDSS